VERPIMDPNTDRAGCLYGCIDRRLGHRHQRPILERPLVRTGQDTAYQLARAQDNPQSNQAPSGPGQDGQSDDRQHHHHCVCQQIRRHTVTSTDGVGTADLGALPCDRNQTQDDIRPISIQSSGCTFAADGGAIGMEHRPTVLSGVGPPLGPTPRRSLRLIKQRQNDSVLLMETGHESDGDGCTEASLDRPGQLVPLPSLEHHPASSGTPSAGAARSNHHHAALDDNNLVSNACSDGNRRADSSPTSPGPSRTRKRKRCTVQEPTLETDGVADKRLRRMVDDGLSAECARDLIDASIAPTTAKRYRSVQRTFITWARSAGRDPDILDIPTVVDYLYNGWRMSGWKLHTMNTNKCAILALYQEDNKLFNDHVYTKQLYTLARRQELKKVKNIPVDISPVLALFRSWGPNESLSLNDLVSKLAWLLGVCGFLRPDDVRCIDVAKSKVNKEGILVVHLVAPKEKVDGESTAVDVHISPVSDSLVCPVQAYLTYLSRLPPNLPPLRHHKHTETSPRPDTVPLLRFLDNPSEALAPRTISEKMNSLTRLMELPSGTTVPRCRAIGSTLAAFHGVSEDKVKTHGRWSPLSGTFEKFYRLTRNSTINFSSVVLAGSGSTASVPGRLRRRMNR
jgi:hypothetical protein